LLNLNTTRIKGVEVKSTVPARKKKKKLKFISLEFAASSGGPKGKPSGVSGLRSFLSSTVLFALV